VTAGDFRRDESRRHEGPLTSKTIEAGDEERLWAELGRIHHDLASLRGAVVALTAVLSGQPHLIPAAPAAHGRPRRLTVVR
jgi:hypothetical protein